MSAKKQESSSDSDPPIDPFVHHVSLSAARVIQVVFMSLTVAPLRVVLLSLIAFVAWVFALVGQSGLSQEDLIYRPLIGWRRRLQNASFVLGRMAAVVIGIRVCMRGHRRKVSRKYTLKGSETD